MAVKKYYVAKMRHALGFVCSQLAADGLNSSARLTLSFFVPELNVAPKLKSWQISSCQIKLFIACKKLVSAYHRQSRDETALGMA